MGEEVGGCVRFDWYDLTSAYLMVYGGGRGNGNGVGLNPVGG